MLILAGNNITSGGELYQTTRLAGLVATIEIKRPFLMKLGNWKGMRKIFLNDRSLYNVPSTGSKSIELIMADTAWELGYVHEDLRYWGCYLHATMFKSR